MTKQEVFDRVYDHFVTKKSPPSMSHGMCRLKQDPDDANSPRCAIGLFISDYTPDLEDVLVYALIDSGTLPTIDDNDRKHVHRFWYDLRIAHDAYADCPEFHTKIEAELRDMALLHRLKEITK